MRKVTPEEVKENMQDVTYDTVQGVDRLVTYVTVRMKNGYTLRESTTCTINNDMDKDFGAERCLKKIEDKIWSMLDYALYERLNMNSKKKESCK